MNNMKMGAKIALGFGLLIVIAVVLGMVGVWTMSKVSSNAVMLSREYVPEVDVAYNISSATSRMMYEMRGFGLSEDKSYYDAAQKEFETLEKVLKDAQDLESRSKNLTSLKTQVENAMNALGQYKGLTTKTAQFIDEITKRKKDLDEAAAAYMKNCNDYLENLKGDLKAEFALGINSPGLLKKLEERVYKINLVSEIIDIGNITHIAVNKSMARRDPELIVNARKNFEIMDAKFEELKKVTHKEENMKRIEASKRAADGYKTAMNDFLTQWQALQETGKERNQAGKNLLDVCRLISDEGLKTTGSVADSSAVSLVAAKTIMVIGLILAAIIGAVVSIFITRSITGPINRVIDGLSEASDQVASAAGQVSMASQTLAEGASEQAASIEETSSSLEEMSSMTKQNADNASEANNLMKNANETVDKANESMKELISSMVDITRASEETSKIIKTIDEIAFQTNLLALNAAVEAARAGEAGAGFAVVADEVRNLALRAADAAKSTAALIEGTVKKINDGSGIVNSTSEAFAEVAESARKVGDLVSEIAAASREQAEGIEQVNKATVEMDKVTQQNAANAEESASASEEMSAQANQMMEYVGELVAMVGGTDSGHRKHLMLPAMGNLKKKAMDKVQSLAQKRLKKSVNKEVHPAKVIPMEDDFTDF